MNSFDCVICGGGTAGCLVAVRLSEDKCLLFHWPVGFARITKGVASWGWPTVPQPSMKDRELWLAEAKVNGGGSTTNAQIYTRGNALDCETWSEEYGCDGWSYREVLPYLRRSEADERHLDNYHGIGGQLGVSASRGALPVCDAFVRAAQQYGIPCNPNFYDRRQAGIGNHRVTQRNVRRSSCATAFLSSSESQPNLKILTATRIDRIRTEQGRAVGFDCPANGRCGVFREEQEPIVCSGAVGTPGLMMLAVNGPVDHLQQVDVEAVHDLPGVGSNLQDHIDPCTISECTGRHSCDGVDHLDRMAVAGLQYLLFKSGPMTASLFETGGFRFADSNARPPDIQFHFGQGSGIEKGIARISGAGATLNSALMRPRFSGTVRMRSGDPSDAPLTDPNCWDDPFDLETSLNGPDMACQMMRQQALKPYIRKEVRLGPNVADRVSLIDCACRMAMTDHHPFDTCRKGTGRFGGRRPAAAGPRHRRSAHLRQVRSCRRSSPPTQMEPPS